jgi:N-acetylglutamate synthase-like GNAT family acetyltransferase
MSAPRLRPQAVSEATVEIEAVQPERTAEFRRTHEREALSTEWNFRVIWHEQRHELAATQNGEIVGVAGLRIAASLAHLESLIVSQDQRRRGIGRRLVERSEELANYYNCHKVTVEVPSGLPAHMFFEACGYKTEAILPQHTWKLDVAVMRKFLL